MRAFLSVLVFYISAGSALAQMQPLAYAEAVVDAPVADVWSDWTTPDGLEAFFAPKAVIDLKPGGAYEVWFLPEAEPGQRGADNGIILGLQENRMIHFTWAMPPYMEEIRPHMTSVQIFFDPLPGSKTRVRLYHTGFGGGEAWDKGRAYFVASWPQVMELYRGYRIKAGTGLKSPD